MPVTDFTTDTTDLTITITAEFAAPVERVWEIYADPRQLERVWGPPGFPATFTRYEFEPGGGATYYMSGPEGERYGGWWRFTEITAPESLLFDDGFADDDLQPIEDMPVSRNVFRFTGTGTGTRAVYTSTYASAEDLQKVIDMGVQEGSTLAINQIDALLAG